MGRRAEGAAIKARATAIGELKPLSLQLQHQAKVGRGGWYSGEGGASGMPASGAATMTAAPMTSTAKGGRETACVALRWQ